MNTKTNKSLITLLKEKYLKHPLFYNCIFLSFLFFLHCFWGGITYIVFPLIAIFMLCSNIEDGLSYIIFTLPYMFINPDTSSYIYYSSIILYIIKCFYIVFFKEKQKLDFKLIAFMLIFLLYLILPFGNYNKNWIFKICYFIFIFTAILALKYKPNIFNVKKNVCVLCYSLIVSFVLSLSLYSFAPFLETVKIMIHKSNRFPAFLGNPNTLAMQCEIILGILTYFIITNKHKLKYTLLFLFISLIGISTFSKMLFIILFLLLLCLIVYGYRLNKKLTTLVLFAFLFLLCVAIAIFPNFAVRIFDRFFGSIKDYNSFYSFTNVFFTGRTSIWKQYLSYIFTHPKTLILGNGTGAESLLILFFDSSTDLRYLSPHNFYISLIYQLGIVGTLLLVGVIICSIKQIKTKPINKAILIPIIVIALIFLIEDTFLYIM